MTIHAADIDYVKRTSGLGLHLARAGAQYFDHIGLDIYGDEAYKIMQDRAFYARCVDFRNYAELQRLVREYGPLW